MSGEKVKVIVLGLVAHTVSPKLSLKSMRQRIFCYSRTLIAGVDLKAVFGLY